MKKAQILIYAKRGDKEGHYFLDPPRPQPKCHICGDPRKRHGYLCKFCHLWITGGFDG